MGTSSLYKGPRRTALLPEGYGDDGDLGVTPNGEPLNEPEETPDNPENEGNNQGEPHEIPNSGSRWSTARRSVSKTAGGGSGSIKKAASSYTKALGGSKNAARQAKAAQRITAAIYTLFTGSPTEVRENLEKAGIQLEGRSNTDIFKEICQYLSPSPDDLENALINKALSKTIAEIVSADGFDSTDLEIFNHEMLNKLVSGVITNYIYEKLLNQAGQGMLNKKKSVTEVKDAERKLKGYVSKIVKHSVKTHLQKGISGRKIMGMVNKLYETSYSLMESMV